MSRCRSPTFFTHVVKGFLSRYSIHRPSSYHLHVSPFYGHYKNKKKSASRLLKSNPGRDQGTSIYTHKRPQTCFCVSKQSGTRQYAAELHGCAPSSSSSSSSSAFARALAINVGKSVSDVGSHSCPYFRYSLSGSQHFICLVYAGTRSNAVSQTPLVVCAEYEQLK